MLSITIFSSSRKKPPVSRAILLRMKNAILGRRYELSVVFVASSQMRRLNGKYRRKDESTDILSFPISKYEGEILIAPSVARREARKFGRPFENFILFLLVHGLLHLKGHKHGKKMESVEQVWREKFRI